LPDPLIQYAKLLKAKSNKESGGLDIEEWQKYWSDAGPVRFAEEVLTCPLKVPEFPNWESLPNDEVVCLGCSMSNGREIKHRRFREDGTPYHIILSEKQKVFLIDIWKNGVNMALLVAGRGAGKTFILAIFNCWKISTQNKEKITCMGGSSEQSDINHDYIDDWRIDVPILNEIIYKSVRGIKRYVKTVGRSVCMFPACSPTAARGQHVNIVEIDEACEGEDKSEDGAKAVKAVQWQTTGKRDAMVILASTAHYIHGMFYEYMTKPEFGYKVYHWGIAEHVSRETDPYKVYTDKDPSHWRPAVWWITQKEVEDKRRSKSDEEWLCEALGGASMASGAVFTKEDLKIVICDLCENCDPYKWDTCKLVKLGVLGTEDDPTKNILEMRAGYDHGISSAPSALTIIGRKMNVTFVLFNDEQIGLREEDKLNWIRENCKRWKTMTFIPDPAASGQHIHAKLSDEGYAVYVLAENEKIARVYNVINFVEKHRIIIPKTFWFLTQSLRKLAWDKNNKIRKVEDHSFDSLCYALEDWSADDEAANIFDQLMNTKIVIPKIDDVYGVK
jgi:hypothetical protein